MSFEGYVPVLTPYLTSSAGLSANFGSETLDFLDDEFLHSFDGVFLFKAEIEDLWNERQ